MQRHRVNGSGFLLRSFEEPCPNGLIERQLDDCWVICMKNLFASIAKGRWSRQKDFKTPSVKKYAFWGSRGNVDAIRAKAGEGGG